MDVHFTPIEFMQVRRSLLSRIDEATRGIDTKENVAKTLWLKNGDANSTNLIISRLKAEIRTLNDVLEKLVLQDFTEDCGE